MFVVSRSIYSVDGDGRALTRSIVYQNMKTFVILASSAAGKALTGNIVDGYSIVSTLKYVGFYGFISSFLK